MPYLEHDKQGELMTGRRDCDGNGHSPAVAARHAQVDCLCPPPVDGILWIHCMEDGGLIHVDGEGRQLILIVDNGNNFLEVPEGLVTHFLWEMLYGVHCHAVDEAILSQSKK